jgi:hypothetical protein
MTRELQQERGRPARAMGSESSLKTTDSPDCLANEQNTQEPRQFSFMIEPHRRWHTGTCASTWPAEATVKPLRRSATSQRIGPFCSLAEPYNQKNAPSTQNAERRNPSDPSTQAIKMVRCPLRCPVFPKPGVLRPTRWFPLPYGRATAVVRSPASDRAFSCSNTTFVIAPTPITRPPLMGSSAAYVPTC